MRNFLVRTTILFVSLSGLQAFADQNTCSLEPGIFKYVNGDSPFPESEPQKISMYPTCDNTGAITELNVKLKGKNFDSSDHGWTSYSEIYSCNSTRYCERTRICYVSNEGEYECDVPHGGSVDEVIQVVDKDHIQFISMGTSNYLREARVSRSRIPRWEGSIPFQKWRLR